MQDNFLSKDGGGDVHGARRALRGRRTAAGVWIGTVLQVVAWMSTFEEHYPIEDNNNSVNNKRIMAYVFSVVFGERTLPSAT
ncbi:hypothetical protein V5799_022857 [Amblyomma americanum]|uniref:Uncharacterized protein n=1 Tax=Amblyomma americanum TaxID=6943 RepID=A0AAQ4FJB5_AMBAM